MTAQVPQEFVVGAVGYRVIRAALMHRAIDREIETTTRGFVEATGLSPKLTRRLLAGETVSAAVVTRVFRHLASDGDTVADLFVPVPESL
jgi:hypothetical protein